MDVVGNWHYSETELNSQVVLYASHSQITYKQENCDQNTDVFI